MEEERGREDQREEQGRDNVDQGEARDGYKGKRQRQRRFLALLDLSLPGPRIEKTTLPLVQALLAKEWMRDPGVPGLEWIGMCL